MYLSAYCHYDIFWDRHSENIHNNYQNIIQNQTKISQKIIS